MSKQIIGMTRSRRPLMVMVGASLVLAIAPQAAIGHGATITIQDQRAYKIEAVYDSGKPMAGAQVSVFHESNPQTVVETGTIDEQGHWIWTAEQSGTWTFQVRQAGHGGVVELEVLPIGEGVTSTAAHEGAGSRAMQAPTGSPAAKPIPRWVAIGSVVWGAIGTALFFSRRSAPLSET